MKQGYFPHLNLMRAFAAFAVILYHVIVLLPWEQFPHTGPLSWFRMGWMGVDLFFVISGFVITSSALALQREQTLPAARKIFLRRRLARIAPLYLFTCVFFVLFVQPELMQQSGFGVQILTHLLFLHNLSPDWHGTINGPTWSIGAEMQFYMLICLLMPWLVRRSALQILLVMFAVGWIGRVLVVIAGHQYQLVPHHLFIYSTQMPMMLDVFGLGMAYARWRHDHPNHALPLLPLLLAIVTSCALAFYLLWTHTAYWSEPLMVIFWRTLFGIGAITTLMLFTRSRNLPSGMAGILFRVGHYLGDISYGLYLWHMPVLLLLKQQSIFTNQPLLFFATTSIITVILSSLSWHLLEKRCIRLFR